VPDVCTELNSSKPDTVGPGTGQGQHGRESSWGCVWSPRLCRWPCAVVPECWWLWSPSGEWAGWAASSCSGNPRVPKHGSACCYQGVDGEAQLQAVPRGWDSATLQKVFFRLLDETQGAAGHLVSLGRGWALGGGSRTTYRLPPRFLLPGPLVPSCPQLPRGVLRGWLGARQLLAQRLCSVPSREAGAAGQAAGCAPGAASMGRVTLTVEWLPPPAPAPSSAKDTRCETATG